MFDKTHLNKIKTAAGAIYSRRDEYRQKAKPFIDKSVKYCKDKPIKYCKDNPSDVMLGIMTLLIWDMESDIDDIESAANMSAAVDYHTYTTTRG